MPQLSSNFILRSKLPNFERDSFKTWQEMVDVNSAWMDEGHISYCEEKKEHYVFRSIDGSTKDSLIGDKRWTKLITSAPTTDDSDTLQITSVESKDVLTTAYSQNFETGSLIYTINENEYYYCIKNDGFYPLIPANVITAEVLESKNYATQDSLSNYTTSDTFNDLQTKVNEIDTTVSEIQTSLNEDYISKTALEDVLQDYVSTEDLNSNYVTNDELNSLSTSFDEKMQNYPDKTFLGVDGLSIGVPTEDNPQTYEYASFTDYLKDTFVSKDDPTTDLDDYISEETLNEKLQDYVTVETFETTTNTISTLDADVKNVKESLDDFATKESLGDYIKKDELPEIDSNILKDYAKKEDLEPLANQISTINAATGAIGANLEAYKNEVADTYVSKDYVDNRYVNWETFQTNSAITINRISNVESDIETIKDDIEKIQNNGLLDEYKEEVAQTYTTKEELSKHIYDFEAYKEEVEATYAKPEDISSKLNNYAPSVEHENRWIGADCAGDLAGKTGKEVANAAYSYSAVFDQMLFSKFTPTVSQPSVEVELKENWKGDLTINWYDAKNRVILVEAGIAGPDGGDFKAVNAIDSIITYPKGIDLSTNFTNGLIPSTDEKQTSIGFCRVQDENGEWVYYRKENNIYHVPATLDAGEYRYYMAAYFQKGSPALDNDGMTVAEWNENTPIESKDYITIIASKPTYYNSKDGFVKNPIILWSDNMEDYMTLKPSCQLAQAFKLPRKIKELYIWNDISGYAKVPMVYQKDGDGLLTENLVPAYFSESVDENDYYTYIYNSDENGHRGEIKIKVTF